LTSASIFALIITANISIAIRAGQPLFEERSVGVQDLAPAAKNRYGSDSASNGQQARSTFMKILWAAIYGPPVARFDARANVGGLDSLRRISFAL